jgi:transcriptional regulator NrdR family protein
MKCILCNKQTGVVDTRLKHPHETIRRRECLSCNVRFNTIEKILGKVSRDREKKIKIKDVVIRSEDDWVVRVPKSDYADRIFGKI